jgi:hypothetical protein
MDGGLDLEQVLNGFLELIWMDGSTVSAITISEI